jgi:hypothetical protein
MIVFLVIVVACRDGGGTDVEILSMSEEAPVMSVALTKCEDGKRCITHQLDDLTSNVLSLKSVVAEQRMISAKVIDTFRRQDPWQYD